MKRLRTVRSMVAGLAAATASIAAGQDLTPKAPPQDHPVFLVGGTVHTVSGQTIEAGVVGFSGGVVTMVGPASAMSRASLSPDAEVIDVSGRHVYPGLFAAQTRLGLVEIGAVRASDDFDELGQASPEVFAAVAVNPDSTLLPVARAGGVLLAGSFPQGGLVPGRASVIHLDGWTWEDMAVQQDAALIINWPRTRPFVSTLTGKPSPEAAERIREALDAIDGLFDDAEAYRDAKASGRQTPTDLRLEAMLPYLPGAEPQRRLVIDADEIDDITSAVNWATRRGLRLTISGGAAAPLCAELLKSAGVAVILQGTHTFPARADAPHDAAYTLPARLHAAGVPFAINTSDRDGNARNLPHEAGMAARYGLPPDEAVRAITLSPAEILGVADRYGSIESGKSATLIVADGDILEVTTNVERAFIDGRAIDLSTKQTGLRDKYEQKYRQLDLIKP